MGLFWTKRSDPTKTPVFVLGCQRSGTTMLIRAMSEAPNFSVFQESDSRAMRVKPHHRLRDERTIRRLIARDPNRFVVFKPLNDSQHADRLLSLHPNARVIWIYRGHADTSNSMVRKWGAHERHIIEWITKAAAANDLEGRDEPRPYPIYAERIEPTTVAELTRLDDGRLTDEEGAALVWYIRNRIFFDRALDRDRRALLVKYETLVSEPEPHLGRIADFLQGSLHTDYSARIVDSSVGKEPAPHLRGEVLELCRQLEQQFDEVYSRQAPVVSIGDTDVGRSGSLPGRV